MTEPNQNAYLEKELFALLKDESSLLNQLIDMSLDGLWFWDISSKDNQWVSQQFWQTLGFNPSERMQVAAEMKHLMVAEDYDKTIALFKEILSEKQDTFDQLIRFKHNEGSTVWMHCKGLVLRNNQDEPYRILGTLHDISQLKELEQRYTRNLDAMDRLYASTKLALEESVDMFNASPDAILQIDYEGNITKANQQATNIFQYSQDELLSISVEQLIPSSLRNAHRKHRNIYEQKPITRDMGAIDQPLYALTKHNKQIRVDVRLTPIETKFGKQVLTVIRDITDRVILQDKLRQAQDNNTTLHQLATTDELMDISNRRNFIANFDREFKLAKRHHRTMTLIILDVDRFKNINDEHGHDIGDAALIFIAASIKKLLRGGDFFARLGGDELAIFTPETDQNSSKVLIDRIFYFFETTLFTPTKKISIKISLSAGIAELKEQDKSYEKLIKRADELLFEAKKSGRNKFIADDDD